MDDYNFTISYEFDGNFSYAFESQPASGFVNVSGADRIEKIMFNKITSEDVLTLVEQPSISVVNETPSISLTYMNNLPLNLDGTLVAVLNDSARFIS